MNESEGLIEWKTPRQSLVDEAIAAGHCVHCDRPPYKTGAEGEPLCEHHAMGLPDPFVRSGPLVGRNDPCPCRNGKKFKLCGLRGRCDAGGRSEET